MHNHTALTQRYFSLTCGILHHSGEAYPILHCRQVANIVRATRERTRPIEKQMSMALVKKGIPLRSCTQRVRMRTKGFDRLQNLPDIYREKATTCAKGGAARVILSVDISALHSILLVITCPHQETSARIRSLQRAAINTTDWLCAQCRLSLVSKRHSYVFARLTKSSRSSRSRHRPMNGSLHRSVASPAGACA